MLQCSIELQTAISVVLKGRHLMLESGDWEVVNSTDFLFDPPTHKPTECFIGLANLKKIDSRGNNIIIVPYNILEEKILTNLVNYKIRSVERY